MPDEIIEEKKLKNFFEDIKQLCREQGKSNMIPKQVLEELIREVEK